MLKKKDFDHSVTVHHERFKLKPGSHGAQLINLFTTIDEDGFSDVLSLVNEQGQYIIDGFGNGASKSTRKGGSLDKIFNIKHIRKSGAHKNSKIVAVQLVGYKKNTFNNTIPDSVYKHFKDARCVIADTTGNIQIDHKDGRKDDYTGVTDLDEYQPMKEQNNAYGKRTHCKNCKESNLRYDAKRLGYRASVTKGSLNYEGTCIGCYWYDPPAFNREISKHWPNNG